MSNKIVLSFSVCSNGDLILESAGSQQFEVTQDGPNRWRFSYLIQSKNSSNPSPRSEVFNKYTRIGEILQDGTIYAGISPNTGQPFFVPQASAMQKLSIENVRRLMVNGELFGYRDWRFASHEEYQHLLQHRNSPEIQKVFGTRKIFFMYNSEGQCRSFLTNEPKKEGISRSGGRAFFIAVRYKSLRNYQLF